VTLQAPIQTNVNRFNDMEVIDPPTTFKP